MRSGSFSYVAEAPASPEAAMALLGDLTRQGELHPLIIAVEERPAPAGVLASFRITDRLRWGPFTFRIVYVADVLERTDRSLHMTARQAPSTTVDNRTTVTPVGGGVRVDVQITLTAPTLLFGYAFRQARAAHLELGARIARALGAPT